MSQEDEAGMLCSSLRAPSPPILAAYAAGMGGDLRDG
jgi:hypothetical protein